MKNVLLTVACVLLAVPVSAQSTQGFAVDVGLNGTNWTVDDDGLDFSESGGGLDLALSFGFTDQVGLNLRADVANMDGGEYTLAHVDLTGSYYFGQGATRPFAELGFSTRGATIEIGEVVAFGEGVVDFGELELNGTAITLGGGVMHFVSPQIALQGRLLVSQGEFTDVEVRGRSGDIELDARSLRLNLGIRWYPNR